MDDTSYHKFFVQPTHPYHRQYEALRAVFVDGCSQKKVAEEFGFRYHTLRQMVYDFRRYCDAGDPSQEPPFFES